MIRKISVGFAVVIFMIMALAGQICQRPLMTCCIRAVTGAIIAYVVVTFAAKAVFSIFIDAIAKSRAEKKS